MRKAKLEKVETKYGRELYYYGTHLVKTQCTKCKEIKPLTEFNLDKHNALGIDCDCKVCHNKRLSRQRGFKQGDIVEVKNKNGQLIEVALYIHIGSIGYIKEVDNEDATVLIKFDGLPAPYWIDMKNIRKVGNENGNENE